MHCRATACDPIICEDDDNDANAIARIIDTNTKHCRKKKDVNPCDGNVDAAASECADRLHDNDSVVLCDRRTKGGHKRSRSEKSNRKRQRPAVARCDKAACPRPSPKQQQQQRQLPIPAPTLPAPMPLAPRTLENRPTSFMTLGAFRHFVRTLPPTAKVDLADEPPIVVMDSAALCAQRIMFAHGWTTVSRFLARLGIAGPFDDIVVMPVHAPPLTHGADRGVRLCRPPREPIAATSLPHAMPTLYDMCCETILERARHVYATCGIVATANVVADLVAVLTSDAVTEVALYVCDSTLVTRQVALGLLTLGESRSDIDEVFVCAAWTVTPRASVGIYERRRNDHVN